MKTTYLLLFGIVLAFNLHAQTPAETQSQLQTLEATEPTPAADVPKVGQFYSANLANQGMFAAIYPGNMNLPAWSLSENQSVWLVDDLASATAARAQAGSRTMSADDAGPPVPGGGNDTNNPVNPYSVPWWNTNLLFLQITNFYANTAYLNLCNATDYIYAVWSSPSLSVPFADWTILTEIFPTDTNVMPFSVNAENSGSLFLRAQDWTGVTANGNTTPLWWFWWYFHTTDLSDSSLDSGENTLLSDYKNNLDPNIIYFGLTVTNQYVNSMSAPVQVNVTAGVPSYYAVLVDGTNFNAATWNAYTSSNINVFLGLAQGWHDVWIGLRGFPPNATQTWQWKHLNLTMPPVLTITNPVGGLVDEPMIQIYGYCQDTLASISYDISNALGVVTNLPSEVTDQYYDTNACAFTTNYFECLDVPLTNGLNTIIIHATDLAGDTTTTNFYFTLDYSSKTNPPNVQITWPQNGTQISGNNFTCRGVINDPTASVAAQVVFTNSDTNTFFNGIYTNTYMASVERNGNFWLENLPLNSGTNVFTIMVEDAVGNMSTTNISVIQSSFTLTVNPVTPDSQLWQPTVNLTGTISDPTYAVWVNGVKGHNNGDGTWSASNVPTSDGGTASFTVTAYAPNEQQPDGSYGN